MLYAMLLKNVPTLFTECLYCVMRILAALDELHLHVSNMAVRQCVASLCACAKVKGGHFEHN